MRNTIEGIRVSRHIVKAIERHTGCALHTRGTTVTVEGDQSQFDLIRKVLQSPPDDPTDVARQFDILAAGAAECSRAAGVKPRSIAQAKLMKALRTQQLVFGLGPAGCGKSLLSIAVAVEKLLNKEVQRIILCRPAMEAGESLGFLPGGLEEKLEPYMIPLKDALTEILGVERTSALIADRTIELAPLGLIRGRTFKNAFVILDEAQNATREQAFLFLTRLGEGSIAAVVGDPTQVDHHGTSGLAHAVSILEGTENIAVCRLTGRDVVRSPLVASIVAAYESATETE